MHKNGWSSEDEKKLLNLYNAGKDYHEIARVFNKTYNAVSLKIGKMLRKNGIQRKANAERKMKIDKKFTWTPSLEEEVCDVNFSDIKSFCEKHKINTKVVVDKRYSWKKKTGIELPRLKKNTTITEQFKVDLKAPSNKPSLKAKGKQSSYEDGHCKRYIQELFASLHAGIACNVIGLFGREGLGQYNILRKYNILGVNNLFRSYENSEREWNLQTQFLFNNRKNINNVVLQPGDIFSCPPERYMDFDICDKFTNAIKEQLKAKFLEQKNTFVERKAFQLTTSIRGVTKDYDKIDKAGYIKHIEDELGNILGVGVKVIEIIPQSFDKNGKSYKINEYVIKTLNNKSHIEIKAYSYSDSTPMMTFSIRYW